MKILTTSIAIGFASVFCFFQAQGYIYGCTRMYRPESQTYLDIVYDAHSATPNLSPAAMTSNTIENIRGHLYQTENALIDSLEELDRTHSDSTTVVWEHSRARDAVEACLLGFPQRLVEHRLKNVHFIHADEWRNDYPDCLLSLLRGESLSQRIDGNAILKHSGKCALNHYLQLSDLLTDRLRGAYGPYIDKIVGSNLTLLFEEPLIWKLLLYHCLADLEMLYHILASSHHHIVVFAGGSHCEHLVDILQTHTTFEVVYSAINKDFTEISAQELKHIATKDATLVAKPGIALSSPGDTAQDLSLEGRPARISNWEKCLLSCKEASGALKR